MRFAAYRVSLASLALFGCVTAPPASPNKLLTEGQTLDLMAHPDRWIGKTVTMRIYPYDNGYGASFIACLEACDASSADRSIFVIYTKPKRFAGYRGDRAEIVRVIFGKICPNDMPLCLDGPMRFFALNEVG